MLTLGKAISIAAKGFEKKLDKGGNPYILHCLRVMNSVESEEEKIVAVLHDTIEDDVLTFEELLKLNPSNEIYHALFLLTHNKNISYDEYIKNISTNKLAVKVKLADLKDNSDITRLKGLSKKDFDRMEKYHKAYIYLSKI